MPASQTPPARHNTAAACRARAPVSAAAAAVAAAVWCLVVMGCGWRGVGEAAVGGRSLSGRCSLLPAFSPELQPTVLHPVVTAADYGICCTQLKTPSTDPTCPRPPPPPPPASPLVVQWQQRGCTAVYGGAPALDEAALFNASAPPRHCSFPKTDVTAGEQAAKSKQHCRVRAEISSGCRRRGLLM